MFIDKPKKTRSSLACNECRESKLKCNSNSNSPCQRCSSLDIKCTYTLKKSQLRRKALVKKLRDAENLVDSATNGEISNSRPPRQLSAPVVIPERSIMLQIAEIFFENQYRGIFPFIHKPSFLSFLRSPEFVPETYMRDYHEKFFEANYATSIKYPDPLLLMAILALCARFHPILVERYAESPESAESAPIASRYFGWHARNQLKNVFDSPTIQRVQALTLLSSHEWGEGNAARSYLYVGIAARMALVLGLGNEDSRVENFITTESKRRTMWSVYMMDRCNSSGRDRSAAIKIEDIKVRFPAQESEFLFGKKKSDPLTYNQAIINIRNNSEHSLIAETSCYGFIIILFEIWSKIAKWVGEVGGKMEKLTPWDPDSTYYKLSRDLDSFEAALPDNLKYSTFNLDAHIAQGTGANFGYLHSLYFLSRIFLNREYFFCSPDSLPEGWWVTSASQLVDTLEKSSNLITTLTNIKMMVIAPFTGFEVFTIVATCLSFSRFPDLVLKKYFPSTIMVAVSDEDVQKLKNGHRKMAQHNMKLLETWSNVWSLARNWFKWSVSLQDLFDEGGTLIQDEALRHTLHDYGTSRIEEVYSPGHTTSLPVKSYENTNDIDTTSLDFMDNIDLSNMFPGWNDAMNIDILGFLQES